MQKKKIGRTKYDVLNFDEFETQQMAFDWKRGNFYLRMADLMWFELLLNLERRSKYDVVVWKYFDVSSQYVLNCVNKKITIVSAKCTFWRTILAKNFIQQFKWVWNTHTHTGFY